MPDQNQLSDYDFELPEGLIAQKAVEPRDAARLLSVDAGGFCHMRVHDLPGLLQAGDVLVINTSKVIPARLYGRRGDAKVEILLHRREEGGSWEAFARPLKRLHVGDKILFAENFYAEVKAIKEEEGLASVALNKEGAELSQALQRYGLMPLPPYIKRETKDENDAARYQTVYAKEEGSVAAPTAGLHFTQALLDTLRRRGIKVLPVTLHVGAGTFLPVKTEDISQHIMHAEWAEVSAETAEAINAARTAGGRVVAVGTTATRVLETVADEDGVLKAWSGETRIFIKPGYRFKIVDCLMTNFHLPKSTLFMLVSAFAGLERMKAVYAEAVSARYRFYSYGDACFLEAKKTV
jgi:S-adenosylmethionine:tRNA ribosyltransferase-isomerase